jgi:hypothetical protein
MILAVSIWPPNSRRRSNTFQTTVSPVMTNAAARIVSINVMYQILGESLESVKLNAMYTNRFPALTSTRFEKSRKKKVAQETTTIISRGVMIRKI